MTGGNPYEPAKWDDRGLRRARLLPTLGVLAAVVVIAILAPAAPGGGGATTQPPLPPSPIEGVVIAVESAGVGQVKGFTLRLPDATTFTFTIGALENAGGFSPSHLADHQITSEPIRAFYRLENSLLVAYRLEDATPVEVPEPT